MYSCVTAVIENKGISKLFNSLWKEQPRVLMLSWDSLLRILTSLTWLFISLSKGCLQEVQEKHVDCFLMTVQEPSWD